MLTTKNLLNKHALMKNLSRVLMVLAAIALLALFVFPMWQITLIAPQYPQGVTLHIWINKLGGDSPSTRAVQRDATNGAALRSVRSPDGTWRDTQWGGWAARRAACGVQHTKSALRVAVWGGQQAGTTHLGDQDNDRQSSQNQKIRRSPVASQAGN